MEPHSKIKIFIFINYVPFTVDSTKYGSHQISLLKPPKKAIEFTFSHTFEATENFHYSIVIEICLKLMRVNPKSPF